MRTMINCRTFEEFLSQYLEGQLPVRSKLLFGTHLLMCRACRRYLRSFRRSMEIGKAAFKHPEDALPNEVPDDLVRAVLAALPRRR